MGDARACTIPRVITRTKLVLTAFLSLCALLASSEEAKQPVPNWRLDLSELVILRKSEVRLLFLTDEIVLLSSETPWKTFVLDVGKQRLLQTAELRNRSAIDMWPTHDGNFVVRSSGDLILYDRDFREVTKTQIPKEAIHIQLSPDGTRLAWTTWPSRKAKITVLDADTLRTITEEISAIPPKLASEGLIYENSDTGQDGRVNFRPFNGSGERALFEGKPKCGSGAEVLDKSHVLLGTCVNKGHYLVDFAGHVSGEIHSNWSFIQTSTSGRTFALGIQQNDATHFFKNLNPLSALAGVEEDAEEFVLRAFETKSVKTVFELRWKLNKDEPMFDRYDSSIVALAPNGQLLATIRGKWLEVYRLTIE